MAEPDPNQKVTERPAEYGRKGLIAVMFACLLIVAGVAINIYRNEGRGLPDQGATTTIQPAAFNPGNAVTSFTEDLTRQQREIRERRAKEKSLPSGLVPIVSTTEPTATPAVPLTPEQVWRQQEELKALRALSAPMEVEGDRNGEDEPDVRTVKASPNGTVTITDPIQSSQQIDDLLKKYRGELRNIEGE